MSVLEGLQPASVFHFFEEICGIPHISYHEQALSDYCVAFAKERNLFYQQDKMGNVVIIKEATPGYEKEPAIIFQGHLDMVGEWDKDCSIDMTKEPIQIKVEGDYICAKGTTLGGDDGIAVAYGLALLDAKDIPHPRLEVVLTVSEEVGLLGAATVDLSECQGRRLINVDSEEEGVFTVGCAGGVRAKCDIPVVREKKTGVCCRLALEGLKGGHSGTEIHKGRGNANVLMGRFLVMLKEKANYSLASLKGGAKENVIPGGSYATILMKQDDLEVMAEVAKDFQEQMEAEYGTADPDMRITGMIVGEEEREVLDEASLEKVLTALTLAPNGVQAMSMDLPGLVETSSNMGVIKLHEDTMSVHCSIRSSVVSAKNQMVKKLELLTKMLGGTVDLAGDYPSWPYARNSKLRDLCVEVYKQQYGKKPRVETIHAGLECGILSSKVPGLDCISIGPDMMDIHSPKEKLSISSTARVWEFLKAALATKTVE